MKDVSQTNPSETLDSDRQSVFNRGGELAGE